MTRPKAAERRPRCVRPGDQPSEQELRVLRELALGQTTDDIANRLWLSPHTVKSHICNLLTKLAANDRAHAVAIGYNTGLLKLAACDCMCHHRGRP